MKTVKFIFKITIVYRQNSKYQHGLKNGVTVFANI